MKLYAIAISARKPERGTGTIVRVGVSVCTASSEEMARGLARKSSRKEVITMVPDLYQAVMDALRELFGDTSVDQATTKQNLETIQEEIDTMIASLDA